MTRQLGTAVQLGVFKPDTPEWHAARESRLGGSEMAAVINRSPWTSHYSLWQEKAGRVAREDRQTDEQSRGHYLEPALAKWFRDRHPELRVESRSPGTWVHSGRDWQLANPDGLCFRAPRARRIDSILECKTAGDDEAWGKKGTDEVPLYYETQAMQYLDVFGASRCWFAVLTSYLEFREYYVDYDPVIAAALRARGEAFLTSIRAGTVPDLDAHKATYRVVREMNPLIVDDDVEVDPGLAADYVDAVRAGKTAEEALLLHKTRLLAVMGTAKRAVVNNVPVASRKAKNGGTPWIEAARKLPTITITAEESA